MSTVANTSGPLLTAATIALALLCWLAGWWLAFNFIALLLMEIWIWQACDPLEDSVRWLANRGPVGGPMLGVIADSLPLLFTSVFFVTAALSVERGSGQGYAAAVAACAGRAASSMILIPAFVALVISFVRKERPTVDVKDKVIARDGVALLLCEIMLLVFLFMHQLHWWMGIVLILAYCIYIRLLYTDWKKFEMVKTLFMKEGIDKNAEDVQKQLAANGKSATLSLVEQVRAELHRSGGDYDDDEEDGEDEAGILFGFWSIPLNGLTSWGTIAVSTIIAAGACYFLVEVTHELSDILEVPTFFVAVIVAAAPLRVPDTSISIEAALRGDDSGAVANTFGSSIFDICICLSIPLLLNCGLNDWQPVSLMEDGEPMAGLVGLRILLGVLTGITLAIMWHHRQLTRGKALILCGLYGIFIAYAVLGSLGIITV